MRTINLISLICAVITIFSHCAKSNYEAALIGTWEWTGYACDKNGTCKKDIITDENSRETFTVHGLYTSKRARNNYIVKNGTIYFASDKHAFNTLYAEIISIKNGVMLLRFGKDIRRYNRIGGN
jgi:hypothetical protein